jgi:hypothetical protein
MKRLVLPLVAVSVLAAFAPSAHATTGTTTDPDPKMAYMVSGDAQPFDTSLGGPTPAACQSPNHSAWDAWYDEGDNTLGWMLWKMTMEVHKCWNANGLTLFQAFVKAQTASWSPWEWDGIVSSINDGYPSDRTFGYRYRQGKFHYCIAWYCPDVLPWLSVRGTPGNTVPTWVWHKGQE